MTTPPNPPTTWDAFSPVPLVPPTPQPPHKDLLPGGRLGVEAAPTPRRPTYFRVSSLFAPGGGFVDIPDELEVSRLLGIHYRTFYNTMSTCGGCFTRSVQKLDTSHPAYPAVMGLCGPGGSHVLVTRISER